jgi:hypothetical protein
MQGAVHLASKRDLDLILAKDKENDENKIQRMKEKKQKIDKDVEKEYKNGRKE